MGRIWKRRAVKEGSRLAWHCITSGDIARIREVLAGEHAPATVNRALTALRQVLRVCWRDGLLTRDQLERLVDVRQIRGEGKPRGRALTSLELERLYHVCGADASPAGARDGAIIALGHAAGLRSGEIVNLEMDDIKDLDAGELLVRGKGGSVAGASLGAAAQVLVRWIGIRGTDPGAVFWHVRSNGKIAPHPLTAPAIHGVLRKRAVQANITGVSPHCLRKTFATSLFRAGYDQVMVMRSLRHRDLRSVHIYDRRTEEERAAAQRRAIYVPGQGGRP